MMTDIFNSISPPSLKIASLKPIEPDATSFINSIVNAALHVYNLIFQLAITPRARVGYEMIDSQQGA